MPAYDIAVAKENSRVSFIASFVVTAAMLTFHGGGILNALPYAYSSDKLSVCGAHIIIGALSSRVLLAICSFAVAVGFIWFCILARYERTMRMYEVSLCLNLLALAIDFYIVVSDLIFFHNLPSIADLMPCVRSFPSLL